MPGVTTWEQVRDRLCPLGRSDLRELDDRRSVLTLEFDAPKGIPSFGLEWIGAEMLIENGIVELISTNSAWVMSSIDYSLSGLLSTFGVPEEIWIRITSNAVPPYFELALLYPSLGIYFDHIGQVHEENGRFTVCPQYSFTYPQSNYPPGLLLWSPSTISSLQELFERAEGIALLDSHAFIRLEDVTSDLTSQSFFERYSQSKATECFVAIPR